MAVGLVGDSSANCGFGDKMGAGSLPESDKAILDLRLDGRLKLAVTGECGWLIFRADLLRLELRDMCDWPFAIASGARMSLEPFDTSRVCRRGAGRLREDSRDTGKTSSFKGDGGRCRGLAVAW